MIWKSIETAPLGVAVLVYRPYAKMRGGKVELGLKQKYVGDDAPKWSVGGSRIKAEDSLPTHWMPLPPSPHFALGVRLQNACEQVQPVAPQPARWVDNSDVHIKVLPDNRITRADFAKMINRTTKTVTMWASKGWGPRCIHVGGRVFHDYAECLAMARGEKPVTPADT